MNEKTHFPILYTFRRCPYAMRARLAIVVAGFTCELREVKLAAKPLALLEASPKGTVPVLVLPTGQVLDESLDIMHHVLQTNDPDSWLARVDEELIAECDGPFKHHLDRYKYPERHGSDASTHRGAALNYLEKLEARLAESAQLTGPACGLTDVAIVPFVRQFVATDPTWFQIQPLRRLRAWLSGHLESALFAAIMVRIPQWQPGDAPRRFAGAS